MSSEEERFLTLERRIFGGDAGFFWAASRIDNLPPMRGIELAFAGRSNVGKSSLVNALTGRKALARTSHTPGRTQELNFFAIGEAFTLVDMPGYGYAAVGKAKVAAWTGLIHAYLRGRANLARVFLLVDSRHGLKESDLAVMTSLDQAAVSYQLVLTKADEPGPAALERCREAVLSAIRRRPAAFPDVIATSSRTGEGVQALRHTVLALLDERGALERDPT